MDNRVRSKLELVLLTPDAIEAWNIAVQAWGLFFTLSYREKTPVLYVGTKDQKAEPWLVVNTRSFEIYKQRIQNENTFNGIRDLEDRLAKLGLFITLQYTANRQKQKFISLRLVPFQSSGMTTVLDTVKKGTSKTYVQFTLNERWK